MHGVVALLAEISTKFTGVAATDSLSLPQPLAKPLHADIMHVSRSVLPGLEMLFGAAAAHIEDRIVHDIYPAFVKHQLSLRMKATLGAPSARAAQAQAPFLFPGLGHAFCLTDPYRPDNPVVYASDSFAHIIGYPRAEDIPRSGRCLSSPQMADRQDRGDEFSQEIVLNRRWWDKRPFWSHVSTCPLLSSRGHIRFALVSLVDVTNVVKSQDDILSALKYDSPACCSPGKHADGADKIGSMRRKKERPASLIIESHSSHANNAQKSPRSAASSSSKSLFNPFSRMRRSPGCTSSAECRPPAADGIKNKHKAPDLGLGPSKLGTSLSLVLSPDDSLPMYSRFMLLQFVPGSSRDPHDTLASPPPPMSRLNGRHDSSAHSAAAPAPGELADGPRLKVAFCSRSMLELLGLEPAAQDAVLYHDVFDVLSELAGSPSVTPSFRAAVQQRIAASESASLELAIPAGGSPAPGAFSAGLGVGLASPAGTPEDGGDGTADNPSRRARMFSFTRSKKHSSERPSGSAASERRGHDPSKMQRLMSHWTPLKDGDGTIAWIALVVSPLVPS